MRYAEELAIINATGSAEVQHIKRESFVLLFDLGRQKGSPASKWQNLPL
jgi:hypothetical protein